jgi:hypothetical protein
MDAREAFPFFRGLPATAEAAQAAQGRGGSTTCRWAARPRPSPMARCSD